ncbi:hypothetical protein M3I54_04055 [Paraburkholderia sp. CNPSo 3274]|uniref:hypothetical protein n=1 Tax=Paraburkholderia sp. CNPSo 3274 TaxID=2940932 RepID=UPI0020B757A1|nr:hypothetical protein [Paraburkholderia sp. CNPSo 3274]MCP3706166.1 hypothetical protein [Paraburkholderia sp. CNPSo 3274]
MGEKIRERRAWRCDGSLTKRAEITVARDRLRKFRDPDVQENLVLARKIFLVVPG